VQPAPVEPRVHLDQHVREHMFPSAPVSVTAECSRDDSSYGVFFVFVRDDHLPAGVSSRILCCPAASRPYGVDAVLEQLVWPRFRSLCSECDGHEWYVYPGGHCTLRVNRDDVLSDLFGKFSSPASLFVLRRDVRRRTHNSVRHDPRVPLKGLLSVGCFSCTMSTQKESNCGVQPPCYQ
jgi:hypothetical protein